MKRSVLIVLSLCCLGGSTTSAWDDAGHLLIAQIAYSRLAPAKQQSLQMQLAGLAEGVHTYNAVSAASYMDDLRRDTNLYGYRHFVAPPFTYHGTPLPSGHNVVWALSYCVSVYQGETVDPRITQQQALAMVMHLVGDIHQPLHCTSHRGTNGKDDANGNAVAVTNMPDAQYPNVHAFWDSAFQRVFVNGTVKKGYALTRPATVADSKVDTTAQQLVANFPPVASWRRHMLNRGLFQPRLWKRLQQPWNRWMPRAMLATM